MPLGSFAIRTETELVLNLMSFTGPERREVQQRFDQPFADLVEYTFQAIRVRTEPQAPLVAWGGVLAQLGLLVLAYLFGGLLPRWGIFMELLSALTSTNLILIDEADRLKIDRKSVV